MYASALLLTGPVTRAPAEAGAGAEAAPPVRVNALLAVLALAGTVFA